MDIMYGHVVSECRSSPRALHSNKIVTEEYTFSFVCCIRTEHNAEAEASETASE